MVSAQPCYITQVFIVRLKQKKRNERSGVHFQLVFLRQGGILQRSMSWTQQDDSLRALLVV